MSNCCPDERLLSDHPGIIYSVYVVAFIPLAFIHALDFITDKWAPIYETRRNGILQLIASLPSLGYVLFYIQLQIRNDDHKEAAAAIAVAFFNFYHVLRTIWGLIQLYEFRNWNIYALRCLLKLGYTAPTYDVDESRLRRLFKAVKKTYICFSNRLLGKREKTKAQLHDLSLLSALKMKVDYEMVVNSTLIDNEFFGAQLPVGLFLPSQTQLSEKPRNSWFACFVASRLKSKKPEECSVRWLASFLAKFGSSWVEQTRKLHSSNDIAVLACLFTTRGRIEERQSAEGLRTVSTESFVSLIPPLHKFCFAPRECRSSEVNIEEVPMLPYKMNGSEASMTADKNFDFSKYEATIRGTVKDDWHKASLNALSESARDAVEALTSTQLAYFTKLMRLSEDQRRGPLEIVHRGSVEVDLEKGDPRIETFMYQLGYDTYKDRGLFFQELPLRKELLASFLWERDPNRLLFQASVHADNLIALDAGESLASYMSDRPSSSGSATFERKNTVFQMQYDLEINRILSAIPKRRKDGFQTMFETARFTGCITETVRSRLANWVEENQDSGTLDDGWSPHVAPVRFKFACSAQLCSLFANVKEENLRSLHLRLLWEVQASLQWKICDDEGSDVRASPYLVMFFVLGFPGLKIDYGPPEIWEEIGEAETRVQPIISVIPIAGPQHVKIIIRFSATTKMVTVGLQTESEFFNWQCWKNAFMGRLAAQKEWRLTRLFSKREYIRDEQNHTLITGMIRTISREELGLHYDLAYWDGWPPYICQTAQFEMKKLCRVFKDDDRGRPSYEACEPETYMQYTGILQSALDKHFQLDPDQELTYGEAARTLREGHEDEALKVFGRLIANQGHQDALKDAAGVVLQKEPIPQAQELELRAKMEEWLYSIVDRQGYCISQEVNLETLAHYFGLFYQQTRNGDALRQKFLALFHMPEINGCVRRRAIEAGEAFLYSHPHHFFSYELQFYIALAYQSHYYESGHPAEQELAAKYIMALGTSNRAAGQPFSVSIGYLLEKGFFITGDADLTNELLSVFAAEGKSRDWRRKRLMFERLFVTDYTRNAGVSFGIGSRRQDAIYVYTAMTFHDNEDNIIHVAKALNRLGLLNGRWWQGRFVESDVMAYFMKAATLGNKCAMSNLSVLFSGFQAENPDIQKLDAVVSDEISTGMNNRAVVYELQSNNAVKAEKLYKAAISMDNNPIAQYNLAVLYKCQLHSHENNACAERIIEQLSSSGRDLSLTGTLEYQINLMSAWTTATNSPKWAVETEELGDCLGYVKIITAPPTCSSTTCV